MILKLETALDILLNIAEVMPSDSCRLEDCWQRVIAEDVVADMAFPPFDRSPLDGYALVAEDVALAVPDKPVRLKEIAKIAAGDNSDILVSKGTACRIMTGAKLPLGATGIVKLEDTCCEGEFVSILNGKGAARNICLKGEEVAEGEKVIRKGTVINSGVMGMLALLGREQPLVYKKPKVAVLATGSELLPVSGKLTPGKIRNSNSYMLKAQICEAGAEVSLHGIIQDDTEQIKNLIAGLYDYKMVITTGGASVGDYDLIKTVFAEMEANILFDRVGMKPGMPVVAAVKDYMLYLGLYGNPAAAAMSFEQLARPVIQKIAGKQFWHRPKVKAVLNVPLNKPPEYKYKRYVWSHCWQENGKLLAEPLKSQRNGMLKSAICDNSIIIIAENSPILQAGSEVEVMLLCR